MKNVLKQILPAVLGCIFLFSGISKMLSIDWFGLFVYSFGMLSFDASEIAARLLIALELMLGLQFVLRLRLKWASVFALGLLGCFTILLLYRIGTHAEGDCHCFGNLLRVSDGWSVAKNVVLGTLAYFTLRLKYSGWKWKRGLSLTLAGMLSFVLAFAVFPPDMIYTKKNRTSTYCEPCLQEQLKKSKLEHSTLLLGFLSPECKYCKMAAKRISVIAANASIQDKIHYIFWDVKPEDEKKFFEESESTRFSYERMNMYEFLKLTKGEMPLILALKNGKVVAAYHYDDLNEKQIISFLNQP